MKNSEMDEVYGVRIPVGYMEFMGFLWDSSPFHYSSHDQGGGRKDGNHKNSNIITKKKGKWDGKGVIVPGWVVTGMFFIQDGDSTGVFSWKWNETGVVGLGVKREWI